MTPAFAAATRGLRRRCTSTGVPISAKSRTSCPCFPSAAAPDQVPLPMTRYSSTHSHPGTSGVHPSLSNPPLEDDIDEIEELHKLRSQAYELRDRGQATLLAYLEGDRQGIRWAPPGNEPDDYIENALILIALSKGRDMGPRKLDDLLHKNDSLSKTIAGLIQSLERIDLNDILRLDADENAEALRQPKGRKYKRSELRTVITALRAGKLEGSSLSEAEPGASPAPKKGAKDVLRPPSKKAHARFREHVAKSHLLEIDTLLRPKAPVLQAARSLQALISIPGKGLTKGALLCLGTVIHELYTAAPPDRTVGSARTRAGGHHTAFMTSECTRGIAGFAKMLQNTAEFLDCLSELRRCWSRLEANAQLPAAWRREELKRVGLEYSNRLNKLWPESAFPLRLVAEDSTKPTRPVLLRAGGELDKTELAHFIFGVVRIVIQTLVRAENQAGLAWRELEGLPATQEAEQDPEQLQGIATQALSTLEEIATRLTWAVSHECAALNHLYRSDKGAVVLPDEEQLCEALASLAKHAREGARSINERVGPASHYLESVLDRELTNALAEPSMTWNPVELACAAAAYGMLNKERRSTDHRMDTARQLLDGALSPDGTFQTQLALELEDTGYTLTLVWSEAIKAFAQVLELVNEPLRPALVRRLLVRFEKTAVFGSYVKQPWRQSATGEVPGIAWTHDQPRYPTWAYRWTSALSILALDRLARMLDLRINARVQAHFTSRPGEEIEAGKRIGTIFYPDYGLASAGPNIGEGRKRRRESMALLLERMRAHAMGLPIPEGYDKHAVSAVLYGPPGTGKTTLMEALAGSAEVLFVEVTPSDISRSGEQWVERRARAVFKALSFLSKAVICFDEFEPVLQRRDGRDGAGGNRVMDWLTASMLPKLKLLYERAAVQSVAFALQTNVVGQIDDAAIRSGRFDYRVGVYPPDLLSRVGRLAHVLSVYGTKACNNHDVQQRMVATIIRTSGGAMTTLARRGFFSPPRPPAKGPPSVKLGTVHSYIFGGTAEDAIEFGRPDADYHKHCPKQGAALEHDTLMEWRMEWTAIKKWDDALPKKGRHSGLSWSQLSSMASSPSRNTAGSSSS